MDLIKIKELFDTVRKQYPPHYPTKMHDVVEHIPGLLNTLEDVVNYIGFSNSNIAIKNIVAKCINQFLICVNYVGYNESLGVSEHEIENGVRINIYAESDTNVYLGLDILENGTVIVDNHYRMPIYILGQNYSNSILSYSSLNSNTLNQNFVFKNKSLYQCTSLFSADGIEMKTDFMIIPKFRGQENSEQFVLGVVERMEDFYSTSLKLNINGENFHGILSQSEISQVNLLGEIIVPLSFLNSLDHDLNMLNPISELDMTNLGSGGFQELAYNYLCAKDYDESQMKEYYDEGEFIIDNAYMLELSPKSLKIIGASLVHAPYSKEILNNIKRLVRSKK